MEFYLNGTINLRPLTSHIMLCYTHKMAVVSWPKFCDVTSHYLSGAAIIARAVKIILLDNALCFRYYRVYSRRIPGDDW